MFPDRLDERVARIQALEHEGDVLDTEIALRLEKAFITPFDREDIHELVSRLDDVVDGIQEVAETFVIYGDRGADAGGAPPGRDHQRPRPHSCSTRSSGSTSRRASPAASARSTTWRTRPTASRGPRSARLFRDKMDPLEVIKFRDLYTVLEDTIDAAEDAAEVIERIVAKGS